MTLTVKPNTYRIPEYSLTGDLLAYLNCSLQYRLNSKGSLPPSTPVQLWFGEFIHGVMEEGYLRWRDENQRQFPWTIQYIHDLSIEIAERLAARRLFPYSNVFCMSNTTGDPQRGCPDTNHPHQLIANRRAIESLNTWGPHLFPLIDNNEVRLEGLRSMPNFTQGVSRSPYYAITGVADVISSVKLGAASSDNLLLKYLNQDRNVQEIIKGMSEFEIIIDYKGMRRPSLSDPISKPHEWQLLTYIWLREQQLRSMGNQPRSIAAAVIFYLNELEPIGEDYLRLKSEVQTMETDVMPTGNDLNTLMNTTDSNSIRLSKSYREARSIRILPYNQERIQSALNSFDGVVDKIETRVLNEMRGINGLRQCWQESTPKERTCTACDAKTYCINPDPRPYPPTVP